MTTFQWIYLIVEISLAMFILWLVFKKNIAEQAQTNATLSLFLFAVMIVFGMAGLAFMVFNR